jgi:hypothetical protein
MKQLIKRLFEQTGFTISRKRTTSSQHIGVSDGAYDQDGLRSVHNHDFMTDRLFCKAYRRGCDADSDHRWHWRIHIGIWAAVTASRLEGDFVECGVNRGFLSSAIMEFLDWNSMEKTFYLLDTFAGLAPDQSSPEELKKGEAMTAKGFYCKGVDPIQRNFSQWHNVRIIQGTVPQTLDQVDTQKVAYLHLDMNCAKPEAAAIDFFWKRLVPGAVVLMDDYAYWGYEPQKHALDQFASQNGLLIASLPTGQGLLMKPPVGPSR